MAWRRQRSPLACSHPVRAVAHNKDLGFLTQGPSYYLGGGTQILCSLCVPLFNTLRPEWRTIGCIRIYLLYLTQSTSPPVNAVPPLVEPAPSTCNRSVASPTLGIVRQPEREELHATRQGESQLWLGAWQRPVAETTAGCSVADPSVASSSIALLPPHHELRAVSMTVDRG
jgi:hypothetical protein